MRNQNASTRWATLALAIGAALALAATSFAQPPAGGPGQGGAPGFAQGFGGQGGPGGPPDDGQQFGRRGGAQMGAQLTQRMLEAMDKDGDGMVTKEEYMVIAEERFAKLDSNEDGVLDKGDNPVQNEQAGQRTRRGLDAAALKQMDANGDGKIAADEWRGPERAFQHMDTDQDGFLSETEIAAMANRRGRGRQGEQDAPEGQTDAQQSERRTAMVDRLFEADANQDGKISSDEFKGPEERFTRLDKDQDGFVTREEVEQAFASTQRSGEQSGGAQGFMQRFDKDQDGKVTEAEFPRANLFKRLDTNGDGVIDEAEAAKLAQMRQQRGQRGQRQAR